MNARCNTKPFFGLLAAILLTIFTGCSDSTTSSGTQPPQPAIAPEVLASAATFLGSAAGKEVPIDIEQVIFINSVMGLNNVDRQQKNLYGDLWVIVRDEYGAPILDENNCKQPIASEPIPILDDLGVPTGEFRDTVPMIVEVYKQGESKCSVVVGYEDYTQEIVLERLNMIRSHLENPDMLARAFEEAMKNINAADSIESDPAGRLLMVTSEDILDPDTGLVTTVVTKKTIDAPRDNLALYRALLFEGRLAGYGVDKIGEEGETIPAPWLEIRADLPMGDLAYLREGTPDRTGGVDIVNNYADLSAAIHSTEGEYLGKRIDYVQYQEPDALGCVYRDDHSDAWERVFNKIGADDTNIAAFVKHADDSRKMINFIHNIIQDVPSDGTLPTLMAHERVIGESHLGNPDVHGPDGSFVTPIRHLQLETAASLLAAASGKETPLTADAIMFINTVLGINDLDTSDKGDLFGDLWILKRDENGAPILDVNGCVQPLPAEPIVLTVIGEFGDETEITLETVPMQLEEYMNGLYKCTVVVGFEDYVQEVEMGRLNSVRTALTNPNVLNMHLIEAVNTLNTSVAPLKRDLAGRLVFTTEYIDSEGLTQYKEKPIDSPLQSLALYRALMTNGTFDGPVNSKVEGVDTTINLELNADLLVEHGLGYLKGVTETGFPDVPILLPQDNGYADFSGFSHASAADYAGVGVNYVQMHTEDEAGYTCKYTDVVNDDMHQRVLKADVVMETSLQAFLHHAEDARKVILFTHSIIQDPL